MTGRTTATGVFLFAALGMAIGWSLDRGVSPDRNPEPGPSSKSERRGPRDLRSVPPHGVTARVHGIGAMEGTGRKMKAAYALALTVPVEDIEEWLEEDYFDTADSRVDSLFYRVLYERYLDADPEAFLNRSLHKNYTTTHTARYMKEWTRRDPAAAREFLERQGNWKKYRTVAEAVIQQLAVTDKAAALELIEASDDRMGPNSLNIGNGLKEIALGDPDGLMLSAQRWSEPLRKRALDASAEAVLGRDFLEGVAWIQEQGGPQAVTVMRDAMGQQKKFGAQLLKHAAQLPDGWMTKILQYESWSLARNDPEKWLAATPETLGVEPSALRGVRSKALQQLVSKDWDKAAAFLHSKGNLSDYERKSLVERLARKLASRDKDKATAWVAGLGDPVLREAAQARIDATKSPSGSRAPGINPTELVTNAAAKSSLENSYSARSWTSAQTAEAMQAFTRLEGAERTAASKNLLQQAHSLPLELRGAVIKELIESPSVQDPGDAYSRSPEYQFQAMKNLALAWAEATPAAAAHWVESLPAGKERNEAAAMILGTWRMDSPREAERWLNGLPRGRGWDRLRGGGHATP